MIFAGGLNSLAPSGSKVEFIPSSLPNRASAVRNPCPYETSGGGLQPWQVARGQGVTPELKTSSPATGEVEIAWTQAVSTESGAVWRPSRRHTPKAMSNFGYPVRPTSSLLVYKLALFCPWWVTFTCRLRCSGISGQRGLSFSPELSFGPR